MNLISILLGLFALLWGAVAFLPGLAWMYWLLLPFAVVGLGIGALSRYNGGRNLNIVVLAIGIIRLMLGGGIF